MKRLLLILPAALSFLLIASPIFAQDASPPASDQLPDMNDMDRDALQSLVRRYYAQASLLQVQLNELKAKLATSASGAGGGGAPGSSNAETAAGGSSGSWTVTIAQNEPPDLASLRRQLDQAQADWSQAQSALANAQAQLAPFLGSHTVVTNNTTYNNHGYYSHDSLTSVSNANQQQIGTMTANVQRCQSDELRTQYVVNELQRQIDKINTFRLVGGALRDGTPVLIRVHGLAMVSATASMQVGDTYQVDGTAVGSGNQAPGTTLQITAARMVLVGRPATLAERNAAAQLAITEAQAQHAVTLLTTPTAAPAGPPGSTMAGSMVSGGGGQDPRIAASIAAHELAVGMTYADACAALTPCAGQKLYEDGGHTAYMWVYDQGLHPQSWEGVFINGKISSCRSW